MDFHFLSDQCKRHRAHGKGYKRRHHDIQINIMLHRFYLLPAFRPSLETILRLLLQITIVKIIVLILADKVFVTGSHVNRPLNTKLIKTTPPKTLFFFVGGMTIAKNMPYNATLSALTAEAGQDISCNNSYCRCR